MVTAPDAGMRHRAKVTRVIDGDTFECTVELDFDIALKITVRIYGCDAFEVHGPEKPKGLAAKDYVASLISACCVEVVPYKKDDFGRWLCDVYFKGKSMVTYLKEHNYLKPVGEGEGKG